MKYEILQLTGEGETQTAVPGTETGPAAPAGAEDGAAERTEQPGEAQVPAQDGGAQPESGGKEPQRPAQEEEGAKTERPVREEEGAQVPRQEAETAESEAAQPGEPQEEERPRSGEEQLPQVEGVLSDQEGAGEGSQALLQETMAQAPAPGTAGLGPLIPFSLGVLAALGVTGLLLWLRRRSSGAYRLPSAAPCRGLRTAQLHELGARDSQQDAFCLAGLEAPEEGVLAAVADGMGGLVDSGQVSRTLTEVLRGSFVPGGEESPARQLQLLLRQALEQVEVLRKGRTAQSGSTLVMCLIREGGLSWLSVGDSRIYLWRAGGLVQLNRDHDFHHDLTMLAMQDDMTFSQADQDPRRENLTSYIGGGFPRKVEWNPEPVALREGDRVVLMSDGVYRALSQEEMAWCLQGNAAEAVGALREAVEEKDLPQQDNFTAVVLEVT